MRVYERSEKMTLREAYTRKLERHFGAEWKIEDRPRSPEMFCLTIYSCMAKSIVFYIIKHYGCNIGNWYTGYRRLWEEHRFLYPDPFYDSEITFDTDRVALNRIKWMLKISSSYAEKLGGVRYGKAGAKLRIQTIEYYTR